MEKLREMETRTALKQKQNHRMIKVDLKLLRDQISMMLENQRKMTSLMNF